MPKAKALSLRKREKLLHLMAELKTYEFFPKEAASIMSQIDVKAVKATLERLCASGLVERGSSKRVALRGRWKYDPTYKFNTSVKLTRDSKLTDIGRYDVLIEAEYDGLAVQQVHAPGRARGKWSVVHLPSGGGFVEHTRNKTQAKKLAQRASELADWTFKHFNELSDSEQIHLVKAMRAAYDQKGVDVPDPKDIWHESFAFGRSARHMLGEL